MLRAQDPHQPKYTQVKMMRAKGGHAHQPSHSRQAMLRSVVERATKPSCYTMLSLLVTQLAPGQRMKGFAPRGTIFFLKTCALTDFHSD